MIFFSFGRDRHGTGLLVPRIFVSGTWVPQLRIPGLSQGFLSQSRLSQGFVSHETILGQPNSWSCFELASHGTVPVFWNFSDNLPLGLKIPGDTSPKKSQSFPWNSKIPWDQSPNLSQSLAFGCPRDFCPGTVPAIFVPVPSVPSSRSRDLNPISHSWVWVPRNLFVYSSQNFWLRSSFRRSLQSLNLCTPFCDASNLHKKHLSNPKIDKVLVPSHWTWELEE